MEKYRIKHNDNIINLQLQNKVEEINEDFARSRLNSFKDSVKSITTNIKEFILKMGKPSFKNRQADKILDSQDYNDNVKEIYNDINTGYNQLNSIQNTAKNNYNHSEIYTDFLKPIANKIESKANDIPMYIDDPSNINLNIREDFNDFNEIDEDSNANVDTTEGVMTLGIKENKNMIDRETEISIEDESNGFPGNKREVEIQSQNPSLDQKYKEYISEKKDREIKFMNEDKTYILVASAIDGNPESMFQYELCNIPDDSKDKLEDFEIQFKNGETWAKDPDNGYLKLTLRITLPEPKVTNKLNVNPYQPSAEDAGDVKITQLGLASTAESEIEYIYNEADPSIKQTHNTRREGNLFNFPERNIQVIYLTLEQHSPYDTHIGIMFCEHRATVEKTTSYLWGTFESSEVEEKVERVKFGQISLENLNSAAETSLLDVLATGAGAASGAAIGAQYGATIGSIGGPIGSVLGGIAGAIIGSFMASGIVDKDVEVLDSETRTGVEAYPGWRWALGLKNLSLERESYSKKSTMITRNYVVPNEIRKLKMESIEEVPEIFYSNISEQTKYKNKDQWIKYYFSVNDGSTWHRIDTTGKLENVPDVYILNSDLIEELKKDNYGYIETDKPPKQIKYKVELSRPDDIDEADKYTPEVVSLNSSLVVLPYDREDENSEY